jgi:hypothetical protein
MILCIPAIDAPMGPTLGPAVWAWIRKHLCYGPGDLLGQPIRDDDEWLAILCRLYEVWPRGHQYEGRRRFARGCVSRRKGRAKTELAAWITAAELHQRAPVRCVGWDERRCPIHGKAKSTERTCQCQPKGGPVTDPYIPLVAYTEEQGETTIYGALKAILERSAVVKDFDIGLARVMRKDGTGRAEALAAEPNARDGARTTFQVFEEALALDTPIPTPTGWTTMGALQPGDEVLGAAGGAVRVLGCSPIHESRQCYRVSFRDGTSLVCDAGHLWTVRDRAHRGLGRNRWQPVRTQDLLDVGLRYENSGDPMWRWSVPVQGQASGASAALPVEPYALGVWLGDGERTSGCISTHVTDIPHWREQMPAFRVLADRGDTVRFIPSGLRSALRVAGILGAKRIPDAYMRASAEQRLALLQGLFDTDGHVSPNGHATFSQTDTALTRQAAELLRLAGYRPKSTFIADRRSRAGGYWKVTAHARPDVPLFRMPRKAQRVGLTAPRRCAEELAIVAVEPVASVPVRCIAVDAPDALYQAGEGMIVTHNTHRWYTPRLKAAYQTMSLNIPKRRTADAWSLEVTTSYKPGQGSIAERTMEHARNVAEGRVQDTRLFFSHRQAREDADLSTPEGLRAAVLEATGEVAAGWSNVEGICSQFSDPNLEPVELRRLWLNQVVKGAERAFDPAKWAANAVSRTPTPGAFITLGFDGSISRDSTGIVATEVESGWQWVLAKWERPLDLPREQPWEVPSDEVNAEMADAFARFDVWRLYADKPHWETYVDAWSGEFGEERVINWPTNQHRKMAASVRSFSTAVNDGTLSHSGDAAYARHVGNAHRKDVGATDDGEPLFVIVKEGPMSPLKIDLAVAGVLSWQARQDAIAAGAKPRQAELMRVDVVG